MWVAMGGTLALAVVIAALVTFLGLRALHFREFQPEPRLSAVTLYDLLKVAFAVAAGVGGVVALVTAYRRQRVAEFAQDLATRTEAREATRLFNERFAAAAGQLGDGSPAVQLAGVYAMAGLADDWLEGRQTCVDVLCACLRMPQGQEAGSGPPANGASGHGPEPAISEPMPGEPEPGTAGSPQRRPQAAREVRHTVIRVITAHLQPDGRRASSMQDWRGLDLDFIDAVLDGGDFSRAEFAGGTVSFRGVGFAEGVDLSGAKFAGGFVDFSGVELPGGTVSFRGAEFAGGTVSFSGAEFTGGGDADFSDAELAGAFVDFSDAKFTGGTIDLSSARITGGTVNFSFSDAKFTGGTVSFLSAEFAGGDVYFSGARFVGGTVNFRVAMFVGSDVHFGGAKFTGGTTSFSGAWFAGGTVSFHGAEFIGGTVTFRGGRLATGFVDFSGTEFAGGATNFSGAEFTGATVDFSGAKFTGGALTFCRTSWSAAPRFPFRLDDPPAGVVLPPSASRTA